MMCLDADQGVAIQVIDQGCVEFLLAIEQADQKLTKAVFQPATPPFL